MSKVTAQKMRFSIKDFFGKCDQIQRNLTFTEKILNEKLHFCAVSLVNTSVLSEPILNEVIIAHKTKFSIKDFLSKFD